MALMALQENSSTAIKKTLDQLNDYRIISEDGQWRYGHRAVLRSTLHGSNTLTAVCCILPMVCNMYIHVYIYIYIYIINYHRITFQIPLPCATLSCCAHSDRVHKVHAVHIVSYSQYGMYVRFDW